MDGDESSEDVVSILTEDVMQSCSYQRSDSTTLGRYSCAVVSELRNVYRFVFTCSF